MEGLLLVIAINASYRSGGEWRPQWRRRSEFAGALLLLPLAVLAAIALQARIAQFGFTAPRIVAVAALLLLGAYALTYAGAALISLGGGRWMQRIESANLLMAFVAMSLIATLVSPLGRSGAAGGRLAELARDAWPGRAGSVRLRLSAQFRIALRA